jgi:hypothetical protein
VLVVLMIVTEFLHIPFTALELSDSDFFCFVLNFYFIFKLWDFVFHLNKSAVVAFHCVFLFD